MSTKAEKMKALETAIGQIERQFGKGSVMRMGGDNRVRVNVIPSGSIALDGALGVGGVPRGRVVEIYGPEASGKTTLALHIIANAQATGGLAAFIDAEHALDPDYAERAWHQSRRAADLPAGLRGAGAGDRRDPDPLGSVDVIVVDSVAALVPRAELEGDMGDAQMGLQARLMSQALRKLAGIVSKSKTCLVFINQVREKIGVIFGNPETTTGGRALKFYASVRIDIRRTSSIKQGDQVIGNRVKAKVAKNKVAAPFRTAEFDILYGEGISRTGELLDLGVEHRIIQKSGSWYSHGESRIGQGREAARSFLADNPELALDVELQIREKLGLMPKRDAAGHGEGSADVASKAAE